jgi:biotin-dependent carboxylase-like uncharacterized protein
MSFRYNWKEVILATAAMHIIYPGIFSTIQDLGRKGFLADGIPPSGAMDSFALRMGNLLLKNPIGEAGIEMTGIGVKVKILQHSIISITGADVEATLNEKTILMWKTVEVNKGDLLNIGPVRNGFRCYLCIAGGIDVPMYLGSKSTYVMGKLGGIRGRILKSGDIINNGTPIASLEVLKGRRVKDFLLYDYKNQKDVYELRVVLGPQDDHVKDDSIDTFLNSTYQTSIHCNRVGYRFEGPQLFFKDRQKAKEAGSDPSNIVDDANSIGAIQVPGGKEPICLGPDGVSMGGYVKIACLITADMNKLAQVPTKANVRFKSVSVEEARQILINYLGCVNEENISLD